MYADAAHPIADRRIVEARRSATIHNDCWKKSIAVTKRTEGLKQKTRLNI
jgi:hypothetical protein